MPGRGGAQRRGQDHPPPLPHRAAGALRRRDRLRRPLPGVALPPPDRPPHRLRAADPPRPGAAQGRGDRPPRALPLSLDPAARAASAGLRRRGRGPAGGGDRRAARPAGRRAVGRRAAGGVHRRGPGPGGGAARARRAHTPPRRPPPARPPRPAAPAEGGDRPYRRPRHSRPQPRLAPRRPSPGPVGGQGARHGHAGRDPAAGAAGAPLPRPLRDRPRRRAAGDRPGPQRMRPRTALLLLLALWIATAVLTPLVGSQPVRLADVLRGDPPVTAIFWQIRLPRILLALLGGAALAVSGLGFQTLFRNALAEPYTLGISSGAALGAVLALRLQGGSFLGLPIVAAASFAGALSATALIVGLALRRQGIQTSTLLLAGSPSRSPARRSSCSCNTSRTPPRPSVWCAG